MRDVKLDMYNDKVKTNSYTKFQVNTSKKNQHKHHTHRQHWHSGPHIEKHADFLLLGRFPVLYSWLSGEKCSRVSLLKDIILIIKSRHIINTEDFYVYTCISICGFRGGCNPQTWSRNFTKKAIISPFLGLQPLSLSRPNNRLQTM